eukprot:scaffold1954_cov268-Pinguiococcus_pyrenoidosus.AAC.246
MAKLHPRGTTMKCSCKDPSAVGHCSLTGVTPSKDCADGVRLAPAASLCKMGQKHGKATFAAEAQLFLNCTSFFPEGLWLTSAHLNLSLASALCGAGGAVGSFQRRSRWLRHHPGGHAGDVPRPAGVPGHGRHGHAKGGSGALRALRYGQERLGRRHRAPLRLGTDVRHAHARHRRVHLGMLRLRRLEGADHR